MTTVFCYFRVADYDFWRAGYARAVQAKDELRSYQIWRGQDDPNFVVTVETFDSREVAEAVWTSQATTDAMPGDGIDMSSVQIEYLDEINSKTKIKPALCQEFQDARQWYKMEVANYSFEAVRDGIHNVLERKIQTTSLEYYLIVVGLICIYARPFTNNWPVGPLTDEIVPPEHKDFHALILDIRNKLFAHADASLAIREDDYPNDVILTNEGKEPFVQVRRFAIKPTILERMRPLVDALIEQTGSRKSQIAERFQEAVRNLETGKFRLNVTDPSVPVFIKLSEAQKLARQAKIDAWLKIQGLPRK
jgi:hypothetical protein